MFSSDIQSVQMWVFMCECAQKPRLSRKAEERLFVTTRMCFEVVGDWLSGPTWQEWP